MLARIDRKDQFAVRGDIVSYAIAGLGMPEQFSVSGINAQTPPFSELASSESAM